MIANVIVDVPAIPINQTFDYRIPERFQEVLQPGMRVIVPFGPRKVMGFVTGKTSKSSYDKLKDIADVLDLTPVLTSELLDLGRWLAEDTLSLYITAFQAMLPQVLKANYKKELERLSEAPLPEELESLFAGRDFVPYVEIDVRRPLQPGAEGNPGWRCNRSLPCQVARDQEACYVYQTIS